MELPECRARFVIRKTKLFFFFVFISNLVHLSSTTYINVKNYGSLSSSILPVRNNLLHQRKNSDFENNDSLEEQKSSNEMFAPSKQISLPQIQESESSTNIKNRKGKQLLTLFPRYHNLNGINK